MENLELKQEILTFRLKSRLKDIANLYLLMKAYRVLKNALYISSGYRQSSRTDEIAERITNTILKIEQDKEIICNLRLELASLEVLLRPRNSVINRNEKKAPKLELENLN